ncbi:MAG: sugar ABC transporter substrate-binding protein [Lachnospiraceae bacterium]|nr:sugar ABC transporter substrate-binding protein [Lachnospiraceae bacterium]
MMIIILCFVTAVMAAGCADKHGIPVKTVGIVMPSKSIERWSRDGDYLRSSFEAKGYHVEMRFSEDILRQIDDIQVLIADDVDVLIIASVDGAALSRTLEDALIKKIPVISYDRLIMNTDAVDCYVSFDNYRVGALQGQYIVDALHPDQTGDTYNIELVAGDPADNNARFFFNGAYDVLKPYIESGRFIVPSGKTSFDKVATPAWSMDIAFKNMQNTLASYYSDGKRLDAVMCSNDRMGLGVLNAIHSDYLGTSLPIVTGQDADEAALQSIMDGQLAMTVYKNVRNEADVAVSVAEAILEGKTLDDSLLGELPAECSFDKTSYDNGVQKVPSFLLVPEVIDAKNIESLIETGLFTLDENGKYIVPVS